MLQLVRPEPDGDRVSLALGSDVQQLAASADLRSLLALGQVEQSVIHRGWLAPDRSFGPRSRESESISSPAILRLSLLPDTYS